MAKNPSRKNHLKKVARRVAEGKLVVDPKTAQVKPARKPRAAKITNPGDFAKREPAIAKPINKRAAKARGQKPLPPAFERFLGKQAEQNGRNLVSRHARARNQRAQAEKSHTARNRRAS